MGGLRMDGTPRPARSAIAPAKVAKDWFKANPTCRIASHWRRDEMTGVNRELLDATRIADVRTNRVVFGVSLNGGTQCSELSLVGLTSASVTDGGNLMLEVAPDRMVVYVKVSP